MFIHSHSLSDRGPALAFLNSSQVQAFPCGRRRAQEGLETYIPFDPEARLNTEANNRKHSGLNGFAQSYIDKISENVLSIVLDGYLFTITDIPAQPSGTSKQYIEEAVADYLTGELFKLREIDETDVTAIYANIVLEKIKLLSAPHPVGDYYTTILRDQVNLNSETLPTSLDITTAVEDTETQYYFSGLSFSTSELTVSKPDQQAVSLKIFEKVGDNWQFCEVSKLPKIKHGEAADSIEADTFVATNQIRKRVEVEGKEVSVPALQVKLLEGNKYQLQFFNVDVDRNIN